MSKKNKKLMCAVYLSVDAPDKEIQDKEEKQFRYIKDYCKGNGLKIVKSYHRAGFSRCEMQKHFVELARQIEIGYKIFVSMPSYKTKQVDEHGKPIYQDVCYPVTKDFREKLYDEIIPEYEKAKDKSNEKARENAEKNHGNPDKDKDKEATPFR